MKLVEGRVRLWRVETANWKDLVSISGASVRRWLSFEHVLTFGEAKCRQHLVDKQSTFEATAEALCFLNEGPIVWKWAQWPKDPVKIAKVDHDGCADRPKCRQAFWW
jgi:hypothetical protein